MLTSLKWRCSDTVALKEWSNLCSTLVSALSESACKHLMFTAKAESFFYNKVKHTQTLLNFFYMKKRLYCKYILFCTFVWNFFTFYTNLFDEIATLYSRLYCDLDGSVSLRAVSRQWDGWRLSIGTFCLDDEALKHEMYQVIDLLYI